VRPYLEKPFHKKRLAHGEGLGFKPQYLSLSLYIYIYTYIEREREGERERERENRK
jgi:hypothetical protein